MILMISVIGESTTCKLSKINLHSSMNTFYFGYNKLNYKTNLISQFRCSN